MCDIDRASIGCSRCRGEWGGFYHIRRTGHIMINGAAESIGLGQVWNFPVSGGGTNHNPLSGPCQPLGSGDLANEFLSAH